jgi:hypothetical protein
LQRLFLREAVTVEVASAAFGTIQEDNVILVLTGITGLLNARLVAGLLEAGLRAAAGQAARLVARREGSAGTSLGREVGGVLLVDVGEDGEVADLLELGGRAAARFRAAAVLGLVLNLDQAGLLVEVVEEGVSNVVSSGLSNGCGGLSEGSAERASTEGAEKGNNEDGGSGTHFDGFNTIKCDERR